MIGLATAGILATALIPAPVAVAGGCRPRLIYHQQAAPVYTYAAQAVQYVPAIKAVKVQLSPDVPYYSSVADWYQAKVITDAVAGRTAELLKSQEQLSELRTEVQLLRRQLQLAPVPGQPPYQPYPDQQQQYQPYQPQPQQQQYPPQQRMPRAPENGGNGQQQGQGQGPVPEKLQATVQANCIRCHGANAQTAGGGIDLRDLARLPREVRLACAAAVADSYMPRGGRQLSEEEIALFHSWATGRTVTAQGPK